MSVQKSDTLYVIYVASFKNMTEEAHAILVSCTR